MPECPPEGGFEMRASCSAEIEGLFSLDAAHLVPLLCRADFRPGGVNRGYWLLHEVQSPARDQKRQANHDEEWSTGHRGRVSGMWDQDLQNRRWKISFQSSGDSRGDRKSTRLNSSHIP